MCRWYNRCPGILKEGNTALSPGTGVERVDRHDLLYQTCCVSWGKQNMVLAGVRFYDLSGSGLCCDQGIPE